MPWNISFKQLSLSSSSSRRFSAAATAAAAQDQAAEQMGMCFSSTACPCEARNSSSVAPSADSFSVCTHFVRLSGFTISPFTARIRIALQFKGIQPDLVEPTSQLQGSSWLDPCFDGGRIPSLEHGGDSVAGSSDSILAYIDEKFKQPSLNPSWKLKRKIRYWLSYVRDVFTPLILEAWKNRNLAMDQEIRTKVGAAFDKLNSGILESSLEGQYFLGKHFTMVDVYLIPFLELVEPLKYLRGIEIDDAANPKLVDYMRKMVSFSSYAPFAADTQRLKVMACKELEERSQGVAPAVGYTVLQHFSIVRHMERLVDGLTEIRQPKKGMIKRSTAEHVGITTKLKKTAGDYDRLLRVMKEHAQMEEKVIFPALEKAERGITKAAIEEHARDFPVMNGVREDIKTVMVLEQGSPSHVEALSALVTKLRMLKDCTKKHFEDEENEILPLLDVAGLGVKQQQLLMVDGLSVMEASHSQLLPFFLSALHPHEIHQYIIMLDKSFRDGEKSRLEGVVEVLRSDDEFQDVWKVVLDRFPMIVATTGGTSSSSAGSCGG